VCACRVGLASEIGLRCTAMHVRVTYNLSFPALALYIKVVSGTLDGPFNVLWAASC
jgi:hypothetical protein